MNKIIISIILISVLFLASDLTYSQRDDCVGYRCPGEKRSFTPGGTSGSSPVVDTTGSPGNCNIARDGICVSNAIDFSYGDRDGSYERPLQAALPSEAVPSRTFCFLSDVNMDDIDASYERLRCNVFKSGDTWTGKATYENPQGSPDADVQCAARCIYWREGFNIVMDTPRDAIRAYNKILLKNPANSFCALSDIKIGAIESHREYASCEVIKANDGWYLEAKQSENAIAECQALCISWGASDGISVNPTTLAVTRNAETQGSGTSASGSKISTTRSACGLTKLLFEDLDGQDEWGRCWIGINNNQWETVAKIDKDDDADVHCNALCMQWQGSTGTATCSDRIQNQGETGVDCGGPCPACGTPTENNFLRCIAGYNIDPGDYGSCDETTNENTNRIFDYFFPLGGNKKINKVTLFWDSAASTIYGNIVLRRNGVAVYEKPYAMWARGQIVRTDFTQFFISPEYLQLPANPPYEADEIYVQGDSEGPYNLYAIGYQYEVSPVRMSCSDRIQNQGETGVDCGGPCPACGGDVPLCGTDDVCTRADTTCAIAPRSILFETGFEQNDIPASVFPFELKEGSQASGYVTANEHTDTAGSFQSYQLSTLNGRGYAILVFPVNVAPNTYYTVEAWAIANYPNFARIYGSRTANVDDTDSNQNIAGRSDFHSGSGIESFSENGEKLFYTFNTGSDYEHYIVLEIKGGLTGRKAFFDDVKIREHEKACFSVCNIEEASIGETCSPNCDIGDEITVTAEYRGELCPNKPLIQIDAIGNDGTCELQNTGGDLQGINITCTAEKLEYEANDVTRCTGTWQITGIPQVCRGKRVDATSVSLYENFIRSSSIKAAGTPDGFFTFTGTPSIPPVCGNGVLENSTVAGYSNEQCEFIGATEQLFGQTCRSFGYESGQLSCGPPGTADACRFDTSACVGTAPTCGNNQQEAEEVCDNGLQNGVPCTAPYGQSCTYCSSGCNEIITLLNECGDGVINGPEECDVSDFNGQTCASFGYGTGPGLACNPPASENKCTFNVDACPKRCTLNEICEQPFEDASCADCAASVFSSINAQTTGSGVSFTGTLSTPLATTQFIACKGDNNLANAQACIEDTTCDATGPCLCRNSFGLECSMICNDTENEKYFLYAEGPGFPNVKIISSTGRYTCPSLRLDELDEMIERFAAIHEEAAENWAFYVNQGGPQEEIDKWLQVQILAANRYLSMQALRNRYPNITAGEVAWELQRAEETLNDIRTLVGL